MLLKTTSLTPAILHVVKDQGTEPSFTGEYVETADAGTYLCRQCGLALFRSHTKFHSACGWPSFDEEIAGAVLVQADADGLRSEIVCARCKAHLGHVFSGEGFTAKNTRHCVNSLSLDFVTDLTVTDTEEAIFAAGCFWGVEYYFKKLPGVLKTVVGYSGGHTLHPTYEAICQGNTGHYESIRVVYNPTQLNYQHIAKYFFEIHDPTQHNGQGPDIGMQYQSVIFYYNDEQKKCAEQLISYLEKNGLTIATTLKPVQPFWPAEAYHQAYYEKLAKQPYCHRHVKRF